MFKDAQVVQDLWDRLEAFRIESHVAESLLIDEQQGDDPTSADETTELLMEFESPIRRTLSTFESQDPLEDLNLGTPEEPRLT